MNLRNLNLLDNRLTIIIAFACSAFYVILMKTFFSSIDSAMEESAKIDGANDWVVLFKIYLPLCGPMLATIGLYYFVERWNSFFWPMILLRDETKIPLQVLLKKLLMEAYMNQDIKAAMDQSKYREETIIYSTIIISIIPMVVIYPFLQKYFVKGILVGAVKG